MSVDTTTTLDDIKAPVAEELKKFEQRFKESMQSSVPLLDRITRYIVKRKGKQIRPLLVMLTAKLQGSINDATYTGASLVELLHTATLVHDDVVDDAYQRRGFFSINALWKNKIAVLVGDYLLSRGLLLSLNNNETQMLQILSDAVQKMSEGELLQIEKARRMNVEEETYFKIIRKKTASLLAACCATGTASAGQDEETVERMRHFGETIGIAFQIKDDLLDFKTGETGKPKGGDIKEKKLTLPLIYTLNQAPRVKRGEIINTVKNHHSPEQVNQVIELIDEYGGIDYARKKMHQYRDEAYELISDFPDNESKQALGDLVQFTTEREH
jgi:octaprenyl-diphosphate synthase